MSVNDCHPKRTSRPRDQRLLFAQNALLNSLVESPEALAGFRGERLDEIGGWHFACQCD